MQYQLDIGCYNIMKLCQSQCLGPELNGQGHYLGANTNLCGDLRGFVTVTGLVSGFQTFQIYKYCMVQT